MFIKWITCSVNENDKENFSCAQGKWAEIQNSKGFIGQFGGWDLNQTHKACIISFWKDESALKLFMTNLHDKIFLKNKQAIFYESIAVEHLHSFFNKERVKKSFIESLDQGILLRIIECTVKKDRTEHFEDSLRKNWMSEMKDNTSMLAGTFSKGSKNSHRYLLSSFWDGSEIYQNYNEDKFPELNSFDVIK